MIQNQRRNRDAARILDILKRRNNIAEEAVLTHAVVSRSLKEFDLETEDNNDENYIAQRLHKPNKKGERSSSSLPILRSVEKSQNLIIKPNSSLETVGSNYDSKTLDVNDRFVINFGNVYAHSISKMNYRRLLSNNISNVGEIIAARNSSQLRVELSDTLVHVDRRSQLQRYINDDIINLIHVNNSNKSYKYKNSNFDPDYEENDAQPKQWKHRSRKLDTYAESLLYVNRIYNSAYGFERRRVPAHMPHLIDKFIVEDMQKKFNKEFKKTSSHRVRGHEDMQFAFSYFYYLMSEKINVSTESIFDVFDTDKSG